MQMHSIEMAIALSTFTRRRKITSHFGDCAESPTKPDIN